ncbi:MAG TPA: HAD-IA family hydrolase [Salinarimonas sp.]|nr:HAD-IA family hydrolase [Salinarimonas sp.]
MAIRALVFDMDGTLTDSDPIHLRAFQAALAPHGIAMDEERYRDEVSGRTNAAIALSLFPHETIAMHERFADDKERLFREIATRLDPVPGLTALLALADARGLPVALVTNAPRANAEHMLAALDLSDRFAVRVLGEEVARPKPDPLPYAVAVERLGVAPGEALAFEDSVAGVRSARGAGLVTVGIATSQAPATLIAAGAHHVVADFEDPLVRRLVEHGPAGEPAGGNTREDQP